jgi:hypothetical protein
VLDRSTRLVFAGATLLFFGGVSCCPVFGGERLTDPTRPPNFTVNRSDEDLKKAPKLRLTSTIIGPQRRIAVINNQAVQVGQTIDNGVLVGVDPGVAMVMQSGRKIHLRLNERTVKQSLETAP